MAEIADPTVDASSSIADPIPVQSEGPNPNPEPSTNPNPHTEPPTNPNPHTEPPTNPSSYPEPPTNPNSNPPPTVITPLPFPPSFRPLGPPIMPPQYGSVTVSAPPVRYLPPPHYPYGHVVSNGFMPVPPPGMPHYQGLYSTMVRPGFPPRPIPPIGLITQMPRPPIPGAPIVSPPIVRPAVPAVVAIEKPQTTVYVGNIASSVGNDFLLSLLRFCGPVKSWKRPQDPSNGTPKGFGFCEFEAAEGILRALRLLTKLNIDGQELGLNINKATREYLDRYVEKKTEREKMKETENQISEKENKSEADAEKQESPKPATAETPKTPESEGEDHEYKKFGIVSVDDQVVDKDSLGKIASMIEERRKKNPLPPPPPPPIHATVSTKSNSEIPKSRDVDADIANLRNAEDRNEDEMSSGADPTTGKEKAETSSPNRVLKNERDRERDKEKREKERDLERAERERDRERVRREKDRESKIREVERAYNSRLKEWEAREREQEHRRVKDKEREKEKQKERRREISKDEDGSDDEDDTRKRRRRRSTLEEKRRKREREKEEDSVDRIREEEEMVEAEKRAIEEEKRVREMELLNDHVDVESENVGDPMVVDEVDFATDNGDVVNGNEMEEEGEEMKHDAPAKKLGFGLVGSGKKATVPSVFHEEDDENIEDKKMRPLVPIDYSTEELQAVQTTPNSSSGQPNILAAAEFAKRLSGDRNRNGRHRDREDSNKPKAENKKLLDAKQLIDMIPKTKEELFSYEINWAVYDKHELHEKMRPWISKKITEFLGEEEETLVEYIVTSTKEHVQASKMLELLQAILDDEAEMFVLKMWRMLIFEIKRVETGLSVQPKP